MVPYLRFPGIMGGAIRCFHEVDPLLIRGGEKELPVGRLFVGPLIIRKATAGGVGSSGPSPKVIVREGRQEVAEYAMPWAQTKLEGGRSQPATGSQTVIEALVG